ncbi:hypothetical protein EV421DRAFT_2023960 [Armillaria borealis]|uniref:Uncharacterized protein n=1 Tax=Armillaria borealis TaxID=47425 RepID=A0AA39IXX9_9AGAR|nr:hypothetical protein EV421DRAFT_2023960 [Armillaria borealis]
MPYSVFILAQFPETSLRRPSRFRYPVSNRFRTTLLINWAPASQIFEWWISKISAVNENCAIRLIDFKIIVDGRLRHEEEHPALDWEDLWTRLDELCLTSSKMASLERVAITFDPQPAYWDILKAEMEINFLGLKKLGREVILDAVARRRH